MAEAYPFNPDISGTHPDSQPPVDGERVQSMADAIRQFPTAVTLMPDGSLEPVHAKNPRYHNTDTGETPPYFLPHEKLNDETVQFGREMVKTIREELRKK